MCEIKPKINSCFNNSLVKESYQTPNPDLDVKKTFYEEINSGKKVLIEFIKKNNPKVLEKFEIIELINKGSSGIVFKGNYKLYNRHVAMKFSKKKHIKKNNTNENMDSILTQEMIISQKLHHAKVIETYAHINLKELNLSILEYGKNGDLDYFVKYLLHRKFISETALNYFAKQILEGLQYLHKCKIVHMDIKPANIIVDSSLNIKIADFNVSCSYANFNPNSLVRFPFVGTSKFIAPEIIRKDNMRVKYSEKIDIYSLGVTLYYLFYGNYPYKFDEIKGKDYDKILKYIEKYDLEFPEQDRRKISGQLKNFFEKILDKNYINRFGIKEALDHPWIKANEAIMEEKENLGCLESFLAKLITDGIPNFNELIK